MNQIPQQNSNIYRLRTATIKRIYDIVQRKVPPAQNNITLHHQHMNFTRTVENILWTTKSSWEDYANVETLEGRIGVVFRTYLKLDDADGFRNSSPLTTSVGFSRNIVPPTNGSMTSQDLFNASNFTALSQPSMQPPDQSHMNRYSMNNATMQQTPLPKLQLTPTQPERVHCFSSLMPPTYNQHVSPGNSVEKKRLQDGNDRRNSAEKKHLWDGNDTSSKHVNEDFGQVSMETQRWFMFMIHVRHCKARKDKCGSKLCFVGQNILKHIDCCKIPDCTYKNCLPTRKWFHHYKQCEKKLCDICGFVRNYKETKKVESSSASLKCQLRKSSEPKQAHKEEGVEALSVDANLEPLMKRLKLQGPSQNATPEKDGLKIDECTTIDEGRPMAIDDPDVSRISVTLELEKNIAEDTPKSLFAHEKSLCMYKTRASIEENVKQSMEVVDVPKIEISSLVELFTPHQVKVHIHSLRQWVGQNKTKANNSKAMGCSTSEDSCQLCGVNRLVFDPIPIYCSPCGVRIKKKVLHYSAVVGESMHYVCASCYNKARENLVSLEGNSIPKARFEKIKNEEQVGEEWVQCDKCEAWQHQICALFNTQKNHGEATKYICPNCYLQEVEQGERKPLPPSVIPGAKNLPVNALSNHIEERLLKKLKKEREERASFQEKSFMEVPGAESLTVRVVASVDKVLGVKERFLELVREENYPFEFPYKSKVILLFQKIENVEVCLFAMFVQEFGIESGPPNQRRVYLSYLDSVKYFRPDVRTTSGEALRTFVYHEIMIGYLDYCKMRGFTSCYIWVCPPVKGDDYIFYCHPEIQKTLKNDKLRKWYLGMLGKASKEDVVIECTNLYDHFFVQSGECRANVTTTRLPYFDGDYWPNAAEDYILKMSQEDEETKLKSKKVISKRSRRTISQLDLPNKASKDLLMMQKLGETICPMKEDFIMVHLQHCCTHCSTLMVSGSRWVCNQCKSFQICDKCNEMEQNRIDKERHPINHEEKHTLFPVTIKDVPAETKDKDDNLKCEFFNSRLAFLNFCQRNHYQFDTLRRAKHSSMMILYHLHNLNAPKFATICTICQQEVENLQGWHCEVCPCYDVCSACYSMASINHSHNLKRRSSSTDSTAVQQNNETNQNDQVKQEKVKELLVHVVACRSKQCQYPKCGMLKKLFRHCLKCKTPRCPHCKKLWTGIRLHARCCRDSQCIVPKCSEFRLINSRQQQLSEKGVELL